MQLDENEIKKFIDFANLGFQTKDDIIVMLEKVQALFDEVNEEITMTEECIRQIGIRGEADTDDIEKVKEIAPKYGINSEQIDNLEKNCKIRTIVAGYVSELEKIRSTYKNFDKGVCFANIRSLLKDGDVKIGQIEREAGVRLGYMARLEKPDNTSEPTMEFVLSAAKMLGVSVDFLVSAKINEITPNETYILKFIKSILKDTSEGTICWKRETAKLLNKEHNDYETNERPHPLFVYSEESRDGQGNPCIAYYGSAFFPENRVSVAGNAFNAELPRTSNRLYVVPCLIYEDDSDKGKPCYEMYIVDYNNEAVPICSSLLTCDTVSDAIKDMYFSILEASSHIQITDKARSVLDAYMGIKPAADSVFMNIPDGDDGELPFN